MYSHKGGLRYTEPHNQQIEQTAYYVAAIDLGHFLVFFAVKSFPFLNRRCSSAR